MLNPLVNVITITVKGLHHLIINLFLEIYEYQQS